MEIEKHFQYVEKRRQANQICSTRKCSLEARGGEARAGAGAVAGAAGGGEKFTRNGRKPQHFDWAAIKLFTIQSIQLWLSPPSLPRTTRRMRAVLSSTIMTSGPSLDRRH